MGNIRKKYTEGAVFFLGGEAEIFAEAKTASGGKAPSKCECTCGAGAALLPELSGNVTETLRKHGVKDSSYYRWKSKYGGMEAREVARLRELERENVRLKRIVAEQLLDITMLKDINSKNW